MSSRGRRRIAKRRSTLARVLGAASPGMAAVSVAADFASDDPILANAFEALRGTSRRTTR